MKTVLWSMLCLFLSGWGSMQAVLAQDLKEMEKNLSAINEELSQKTKEYSWQLAAAYADAFWKKLRSEENAYKDLYYAERKAVCKYRSEALRYAIAYYKEKKQEIPTSYIKYTERSYLLQKGSALELLQKEISALESVQREIIQNITRAKYGLSETGENKRKKIFD